MARARSSKPDAIVLFGAPASGKGTQAGLLSARGWTHLNFGQLIRSAAAAAKAEKHGRPVQAAAGLEPELLVRLGRDVRSSGEFHAGGFLPEDLVERLFTGWLHGVLRGGEDEPQRLVLEGVPRDLSNAELLATHVNVRLAVLLDVPLAILRRRIAGRLIHKASGRTYHAEFMPPEREGLDDVTGEPLEPRSTDTVEQHDLRMVTFRERTVPLAAHYKKQGVLLEVTDNGDKTAEEIHEAIVAKVDEALPSR